MKEVVYLSDDIDIVSHKNDVGMVFHDFMDDIERHRCGVSVGAQRRRGKGNVAAPFLARCGETRLFAIVHYS